jgi:hypothetical protein
MVGFKRQMIIKEIYFALSLSSRTNTQEKSTRTGGDASKIVKNQLVSKDRVKLGNSFRRSWVDTHKPSHNVPSSLDNLHTRV